MPTRLIEVNDLIKLVNLALLTGRMKDGKHVSMLLVEKSAYHMNSVAMYI